jgi:hypothetical protein
MSKANNQTTQEQAERIETLKAYLGSMTTEEVAAFMAAIYKATDAA